MRRTAGKMAGKFTSSLIFGGLLWLLAGLTISCGKKEQLPQEEVIKPVRIVKVASTEEGPKASYPARVRASERADMAFQVPGLILELPAEEGKEVKKGDLLARLDPRDFQTNLDQARGQLAKAEAALELARSEYARVQRIKEQDPGAVSDSLVDQRREAVDRAEAEVTSLKAIVEAARLQVSYTYLRAPFSGVIARRYVEQYQEVQAKQPILKLQDVSNIEIVVDVPENLVARLREGESREVFAEFAAVPERKYPLLLKEFTTEADPITQTFRVTFQMPQPEDVNILPGMTATVIASRSMERTGSGHIMIPAVAVFADAIGNSSVWIVEPDSMTVRKRQVKTGELTGAREVEIVEGLKEGEMVAASGVSQLREGMQVRQLEL